MFDVHSGPLSAFVDRPLRWRVTAADLGFWLSSHSVGQRICVVMSLRALSWLG